MSKWRVQLAILGLIGCVAAGLLVTGGTGLAAQTSAVAETLPAALTDQEFWRLTEELSEPNGYFNSDNLLSNETTFQYVIPELKKTIKPGGVYMGVGPEQNFPYIIALEPKIAFITDIRRGNLHEHLMYKALLEMAPDRADFLSLLFSRKRPAGLTADTKVGALLAAYASVDSSTELFKKNLDAVKQWLTVHHTFKLRDDDFPGVEYVYSNFNAAGPSLSYRSANGGGRTRYPTYAELQDETDGAGEARGYLASEANFRTLKRYEEHNLIVPLVGDFAGPKALRAVGQYVKDHGGTVTTFYTSNVENYLFQNRVWEAFAGNVATLPLDGTSAFIRSCFDSCPAPPGSRVRMFVDPIQALLKDVAAGRIRTYYDVLGHGR